jgi:phosphoglycolate phosphatase
MKAVIFDFDGTIADDYEYAHEILAKLAPRFGYANPEASEVAELRDLSLEEIVKKYQIHKLNLIRMVLAGRKEVKKHLPNTEMPSGMNNLLNSLSDEGLKLAIISSNSKSSIQQFLQNNQVRVKVDIYSSMHLFGKSKPILSYMKKMGFGRSDVIYVGDEVRDIEAARKAGIEVISVAWGFNTREALEKRNTLIADKPSDLQKILKSVEY